MAWFRTLASGSSGNCCLFSEGKTNILIDAGISARRIKRAIGEFGIAPEDITAILLTHEHADHIGGLATLEKYYGIPVYASVGTTGALRMKMPGVVDMVRSFTPGDRLEINGAEISTFRTPHDAAESCGFRVFSESGRSVAVATDLGYVPDSVLRAISGAETVLLESNHDLFMLRYGHYPPYLKDRIGGERGHLSNDCCGETAASLVKSGAGTIILGHLSRENNTVSKALGTVGEVLKASGVNPKLDLQLDVAPADEPGAEYIL